MSVERAHLRTSEAESTRCQDIVVFHVALAALEPNKERRSFFPILY